MVAGSAPALLYAACRCRYAQRRSPFGVAVRRDDRTQRPAEGSRARTRRLRSNASNCDSRLISNSRSRVVGRHGQSRRPAQGPLIDTACTSPPLQGKRVPGQNRVKGPRRQIQFPRPGACIFAGTICNDGDFPSGRNAGQFVPSAADHKSGAIRHHNSSCNVEAQQPVILDAQGPPSRIRSRARGRSAQHLCECRSLSIARGDGR